MNSLKFLSLMFIAFVFIMGCSGKYGNFKRQSRSELKVTKQQLIDNWADYDIRLIYHMGHQPPRLIVIIFDMKNDDKKITVESKFSKVNDQAMWSEIVKENTAIDGEFTLVWGNYGPYYSTGVQEIWGPDNQIYGYIIYQEYAVVLDTVKLVDENTVRLSGRPPAPVGGR
jgi:hypothetical protein